MKVGGRNNGWGKTLKWALKQALLDKYGEGRFATVATHLNHLDNFAAWLKSKNIRDIRQVTNDRLRQYAVHVGDKYSNNYARNLISSANVAIECVREDRKVRVNPSEVLPKRQSARENAPAGLDIASVEMAANALVEAGYPQIGILILLIRCFGLRLKEGILLDLHVALKQARKVGQIDIRGGTKGGRGRHVARWVPVTGKALEVLIQAQEYRAAGTNNLIPPHMTAKQFLKLAKAQWRNVRDQFGLAKIHDLRSAYACERYQSITQSPAPACADGKMMASKHRDREARETIINELGHGDRNRMSPYVGGSR